MIKSLNSIVGTAKWLVRVIYILRSAHLPEIILDFPPHRSEDSGGVVLRRYPLCPRRATRGGLPPPSSRGISESDCQDPRRLGDGSRHHDASPGTDTSFPQVKSHQGVQTSAENSENSSKRRPRRKCPEGAIPKGRAGKFLMPSSRSPHGFSGRISHFQTPIVVGPAAFSGSGHDVFRSERHLRQYLAS